MTNVAALNITPVSGSPTKLKQLFAAAMSFQAGRPTLEKEAIKSAAQAESADGVLRTDEAGLTPGMNANCIQPAAQVLSRWMQVRGEFETELQPFIRKIDALDMLDDEIKNLQRMHDETRTRIEQEHRTKEKYASVQGWPRGPDVQGSARPAISLVDPTRLYARRSRYAD